jgi:hypothetical protein
LVLKANVPDYFVLGGFLTAAILNAIYVLVGTGLALRVTVASIFPAPFFVQVIAVTTELVEVHVGTFGQVTSAGAIISTKDPLGVSFSVVNVKKYSPSSPFTLLAFDAVAALRELGVSSST